MESTNDVILTLNLHQKYSCLFTVTLIPLGHVVLTSEFYQIYCYFGISLLCHCNTILVIL
jgi:hypothetical protein